MIPKKSKPENPEIWLQWFSSLFRLPFSLTTAEQKNISHISLNSSLSPTNDNSSYWLSNSGHFAFGFYEEGNGFAVGIWFETTKQKTVVWTADPNEQPLPHDVKLVFNGDGRLVLQDARGVEILGISDSSQPASSASMLDSGNFVLYNSNSTIIWQSFDSPTDTLLPGQCLLAGETLVSSVSVTNHSKGRFQLLMQADGNLVQYPVISSQLLPYHAYWNTGTYTAGKNVSLNLDPNGQLYLVNSTGFIIMNIIEANQRQLGENAAYRLTIDVDGILRLYSHSLIQNSSWSVEWSSTNSKCDPVGLCGLNSYCELKDEEPHCSCLPGLDFINQNQKGLGCIRNSTIDSCTIEKDNTLSASELIGFMWEENSTSVVQVPNETACREDRLRDCDCEIALFLNNTCSKGKLPLSFAKRQVVGPFVTTIIKVRSGSSGTSTTPTPTTASRGRNGQVRRGIVISGIILSSFGLIALAISGALVYRFRMWEYGRIGHLGHDGFLEDVTLRPYTFCELEKATNGFKDQVGKGAFGTVFKGVLISNGGRKVVAIKRLEKVVADGEREFRNEMKVIGKTHHKNLVKLLGYCHQGGNRLLVHEYMINGSLADFLFRTETKPTWEERAEIAVNIARGIVYLHEECETQIIHCDIKTENILMDEKKCAKIADFGLAKLLMPDQTRTYTGLRGTRGYVGPEWLRNMPITVKADVYSFGIMLLEIICCRRSVDMDVPEDKFVIADWVYDCFMANELENLIEEDEVADKNELQKMIKLGLWCIQEEPSLRPSMKKVVLMLDGTIEIPSPPNPTSSVSSVVHIQESFILCSNKL